MKKNIFSSRVSRECNMLNVCMSFHIFPTIVHIAAVFMDVCENIVCTEVQWGCILSRKPTVKYGMISFECDNFLPFESLQPSTKLPCCELEYLKLCNMVVDHFLALLFV